MRDDHIVAWVFNIVPARALSTAPRAGRCVYANARAARWVTRFGTTRCSWLSGSFLSGLIFSQGLAIEWYAMRVVDDAIEDRISKGRLGEVLVPVLHRELACDDGGSSGGAIVEHLEQI